MFIGPLNTFPPSCKSHCIVFGLSLGGGSEWPFLLWAPESQGDPQAQGSAGPTLHQECVCRDAHAVQGPGSRAPELDYLVLVTSHIVSQALQGETWPQRLTCAWPCRLAYLGEGIVKPWLSTWDVLTPRGHLDTFLGPPRDAAAHPTTPAAPKQPELHMPISGPTVHLHLSGLHRMVSRRGGCRDLETLFVLLCWPLPC